MNDTILWICGYLTFLGVPLALGWMTWYRFSIITAELTAAWLWGWWGWCAAAGLSLVAAYIHGFMYPRRQWSDEELAVIREWADAEEEPGFLALQLRLMRARRQR